MTNFIFKFGFDKKLKTFWAFCDIKCKLVTIPCCNDQGQQAEEGEMDSCCHGGHSTAGNTLSCGTRTGGASRGHYQHYPLTEILV